MSENTNKNDDNEEYVDIPIPWLVATSCQDVEDVDMNRYMWHLAHPNVRRCKKISCLFGKQSPASKAHLTKLMNDIPNAYEYFSQPRI